MATSCSTRKLKAQTRPMWDLIEVDVLTASSASAQRA
uniref:Uncharacterized protein n=1 Tax=Macrostomum lignano TaxID=282301 RepID=A0A1I8FB54_9PLAT